MSSSLVVLVVDAVPADYPGDERLHPADPHRPRTHYGPEVSRDVSCPTQLVWLQSSM